MVNNRDIFENAFGLVCGILMEIEYKNVTALLSK